MTKKKDWLGRQSLLEKKKATNKISGFLFCAQSTQ